MQRAWLRRWFDGYVYMNGMKFEYDIYVIGGVDIVGIWESFVCGSFTYDHRQSRSLALVRSPHVKSLTGGLVVRWVTTGESPLLYVFVFFCFLFLYMTVASR